MLLARTTRSATHDSVCTTVHTKRLFAGRSKKINASSGPLISFQDVQAAARNSLMHQDHTKAHRDAVFDEREAARKSLRNQEPSKIDVTKRTGRPSRFDFDIQRRLARCASSSEILHVVQSSWQMVTFPGVYSVALKRCIHFKDWMLLRQIMDLLLMSNVKPTIFEFTQFFNGLARSDFSPHLADSYYQRMITEFNLAPDLVVFSILIKNCRSTANYKLAESYWIAMQNHYHLVPTSWLYTEMISVYAKANRTSKAIKLFQQYHDKLNRKEVESDLTTFHSYLTVFTRNGDIKGMKEALRVIRERNIRLNKLYITEIMNGYIKAKRPGKAVKICDHWMDNLDQNKENNQQQNVYRDRERSDESGVKGLEPILELKCIAMAQTMRDNPSIHDSLERRLSEYTKIESILDKLMKRSNKDYAFFHAKTWMFAAIVMYHDNDPEAMIKIFERLVNDGVIPHLNQTGNNVVDLHYLTLLQVQFVLRYLFGFLLQSGDGIRGTGTRIVPCDPTRDIILVTGRGKHNTKGKQMEGVCAQFVENELLSFDPPIECRKESQNEGRLRIDKSQLTPYCKRGNHAEKLLMTPSKDWYLTDSQEYEVDNA